MNAIPENFVETFGNHLVSVGKLDRSALRRAELVCAEHNEPLHQVITKLGLISELDLATEMAQLLGMRLVKADEFPLSSLLEGRVAARFLQAHHILPIAEDDDSVELALADPFDTYAIDAMSILAEKPIRISLATPADIEQAIRRLYGDDKAEKVTSEIGDDVVAEEDIERLRDLASEAPVIRAVNLLISRAVEMRASDIHIEPFEANLRVRYRIDGVLREMDAISHQLQAAVISRIKIMARLDIAERRLPQDGRINLVVRGTAVDLRISTMPTINGEGVVIRVLDRSGVTLDFAALGFDGHGLQQFQKDLRQPNGIILVVGPTGSGKTTTLYTALSQLNDSARNFLSVEDPVEYQIEGVNQIQVKSEIGLDFAHVLRSILRHDPDVIMIGEIRDRETADIAVRAALTGHLVLSTLHTNDAAGSIIRLMDMGIEKFLLTASIRGVLGQRLVRRLCPDCRIPFSLSPEQARELQLENIQDSLPDHIYKAGGCAKCNDTGFHGRLCIFEYLPVSPEIQRLILAEGGADDIVAAARQEGMRSIYLDGMAKVLAGDTTIEEVLQVARKSAP
jgi:general secretion pathway protein E